MREWSAERCFAYNATCDVAVFAWHMNHLIAPLAHFISMTYERSIKESAAPSHSNCRAISRLRGWSKRSWTIVERQPKHLWKHTSVPLP